MNIYETLLPTGDISMFKLETTSNSYIDFDVVEFDFYNTYKYSAL